MNKQEYVQAILALCKQFKKTIPEENNELIQRFEEYLYFSVETIQNSNSKFINKDKNSVIRVLKNIAEGLINADLITKQQQLVKDEAFAELKQKSNEIFIESKNILDGGTSCINYDKKNEINEIKKLFNSVRDFNKEEAKRLVSETILDLLYIDNPQTKAYSLRLGEIRRNQKQEEIK